MTRLSELLVVEPDASRREALRTVLHEATIVDDVASASELLEGGARPERLVLALPKVRRRRERHERTSETRALELFAQARSLSIPERVLDARSCDIELYTATRTLGAEVWPASVLDEAQRWYRDGLILDLSAKDRVAQDIAREHVARSLDLTLTEVALVFRSLLEGGSYEAIGDDLSMSPQTVRTHFRNMRKRTGLRRDELQARALQALVFARGFVERE